MIGDKIKKDSFVVIENYHPSNELPCVMDIFTGDVDIKYYCLKLILKTLSLNSLPPLPVYHNCWKKLQL